MNVLGLTVTQLSAVSRGQVLGATTVGGVNLVVFGLHNQPNDAPAQGLKIDALTLLSPEESRGMALQLWQLADEVDRRNALALRNALAQPGEEVA